MPKHVVMMSTYDREIADQPHKPRLFELNITNDGQNLEASARNFHRIHLRCSTHGSKK